MGIFDNNMPDGAWESNYDYDQPRTIYCQQKCIRKVDYTGYPAPSHQCGNTAQYNTPDGVRCTRHTIKELRIKENRI